MSDLRQEAPAAIQQEAQTDAPSIDEMRAEMGKEQAARAAAVGKVHSLAAATFATAVGSLVGPYDGLTETQLVGIADKSLDAALLFSRHILGLPVSRTTPAERPIQAEAPPVAEVAPEESE